METYQAWNHALATYFLQGVACGSCIYLSIDNTTLEEIARQQFEHKSHDRSCRDAFIMAVRSQVVRGCRVDLERIEGYTNDSNIPNCVAFLGLLVLAAYDMAGEEEISETNYFKRLRTILDLSDSGTSPHPKGMRSGSTEPFWKLWNQWLIEQDYIPTGQRGNATRKFINYPISQCLLRHADRDRLEKYFYEQNWSNSWDSQTLFSRLREKTQQFPEYLRNLIQTCGSRYEVISEAIHEVHQQWLEAGCPEPNKNQRIQAKSPNLFAGLYRVEEDSEIEYYLYPKQKPQQQWETVDVEFQGEAKRLESDRPGWYLPIGNPLRFVELDKGIRCKILQPDYLKTLQFPARDFWILVPDPEEPDAGVFATWHTPQLGQPFIILCKQKLMKDLNLLRDERLVNWSHEFQPFNQDSTHWLELHNFQILSQAWQGIFIENWELKDALRPKVQLSISLSGGLRTPNQKAWLQGYAPNITVFGFMKSVKLELLKLPDEQYIQRHEKITTNQPYSLELNHLGSYLIRASNGDNVAESFVRIVDWASLELCQSKKLNQYLEKIDLSNNHKLCGSILY